MMKLTMIAVVVVALAVVAASHPKRVENHEDEYHAAFEAFQRMHERSYETKEEYSVKFDIFKKNYDTIKKMNAKYEENDVVFGVTKYADLTPEEFRARHLANKLVGEKKIAKPSDTPQQLPKDVPTSYDWSKQGMTTAIRNQGQCGSCWAFSTVESVESAWAMAGNTLTELSVEQVNDCDEQDGGCDGGDPPTAYQYIINAGGLESESDYPYTAGGGEGGQCKFDSSKIVAKISNWEYVSQSASEESNIMPQSYKHGPLSICVEADTWQFYTGGIIKSDCGTQLDHCVQLVGWGSENGVDFWKVRNSWGTDWGEDGFIRVERGKNLCGIAEEVTYAIV